MSQENAELTPLAFDAWNRRDAEAMVAPSDPEVWYAALGDQVLGLGRVWLWFASGIELDQDAAALFTWRSGKRVEARSLLGHAEALEAAGLRE